MLHNLISILGAWLLADFISGLAHWAQDRILEASENKFMNMIVDDNILHHSKPAAMLKFSFFENIRIATFVMWPISLTLFLAGAPTFVWLAFFFAAFANGIHWFAHQRRVSPFVKSLQNIGIFSSFEHHRDHHMSDSQLIERNEASIKYCVMTDWVNPVLDKLKFFRGMERLFKKNRSRPLPTSDVHASSYTQ